VLSSAASASAEVRALSAAAGALIVSVQGNPAISSPVSSDGRFTLRGLPEGRVILVFTRDGATIGTLTLDDVRAGQQITLTVVVTPTGVAVVDERRNGNNSSCTINGGRVGDRLELEGDVVSGGSASFLLRVNGNRAANPVQVDAASAEFECTPRSGPNAPTPAQCRASVVGGAKVHVSGTLSACDAASALVRASSVSVQK
jgi:hypothetical protein